MADHISHQNILSRKWIYCLEFGNFPVIKVQKKIDKEHWPLGKIQAQEYITKSKHSTFSILWSANTHIKGPITDIMLEDQTLHTTLWKVTENSKNVSVLRNNIGFCLCVCASGTLGILAFYIDKPKAKSQSKAQAQKRERGILALGLSMSTPHNF